MAPKNMEIIKKLRLLVKQLPEFEREEMLVMSLYHSYIMTETRNSFTPEFLKESGRIHAPKRLPIVEEMHRDAVSFLRPFLIQINTYHEQKNIPSSSQTQAGVNARSINSTFRTGPSLGARQ